MRLVKGMGTRFEIFDVDGTLTNEECFTIRQCKNATPNKKYVRKAQKAYETKIVLIYTARRNHLIPATLEWLRKNDIQWHWLSNKKSPFMGGTYHDADNAKE